jgi:peptidoglycan/xylan/chitin deacetylase (PgdA/CDA1 family)
MTMLFRSTLTLFLLTLALPATADDTGQKRIAITFDDAPRSAGPYQDAARRTTALIDALASGGVDGAMFFATTRNLEQQAEEGEDRLKRYVQAGHVLANHSHAHGSANRMAAEDFLADVEFARDRLAVFPGNTAYFRFPFLNEGDTPEKRDAIRAGLDALGLEQGYVTVDNYDWYLQALFDEAVSAGHVVDLDAWRAIYVEVLLAAAEHYDRIAVDTLGRSPAHVLLLHENDLAALFIDDLAAALRAAGWTIVPALEAYADPIAAHAPDTMLLGQGRVAALAAVNGVPGRDLRHHWEDEEELRALLARRGIAGFAPADPPG